LVDGIAFNSRFCQGYIHSPLGESSLSEERGKSGLLNVRHCVSQKDPPRPLPRPTLPLRGRVKSDFGNCAGVVGEGFSFYT
jgi:hypothetical protein